MIYRNMTSKFRLKIIPANILLGQSLNFRLRTYLITAIIEFLLTFLMCLF